MSNHNNRNTYLSLIMLVIVLISGIYTKDFWIDSYRKVTTGEALGKIQYKEALMDSLTQIGEENRFLITGDCLDESYSFVGYSKDINNHQTPILINDALFLNPLTVKGKSLTVGFSEDYAFLSDKNHPGLSFSENFIQQNITVKIVIVILLMCLLLFFYVTATSCSATTLLYTTIKYITVPAGVFTMIISIFMLLSWFNCFKGSEKYSAANDYQKHEILVDSFNTGKVYHTTWQRSANPRTSFLGYSGDAYSSELGYTIKIDVDEIRLMTDTLGKPVASNYIVWYNDKTQHAFIASYMEQIKIPKLVNKLYNHLFSKIMILFYIGIAIYGVGFIVLKTKNSKV
jgi:hypothetical protein